LFFFSHLPQLQLSRGDEEAIYVWHRFSSFLFLSSIWFGAGKDDEWGLWWLLYIYLSSIGRSDLGSVRLVEAALRLWNKGLQLLLHCTGDSSGASDELLRYEHPRSGALVLAPDLVGFFCPFLVFVVVARLFGDGLGRYVYQLEVKSGWSSVPTCFCGSVPLQGDLSSSELGFLSFFEASDSSLPGDAILRPGR
jgi:hypothetical protein